MKKGFTLIELLAVIAVLAIILIIAVPNVINIVVSAKSSIYEKDKQMLSKTVQLYSASYTSLLGNQNGATVFVKLSDLISQNRVVPILDPINKNQCNGTNSGVLITKSNSSYTYEPYLQCDNYKSDITNPLIKSQIVGNNLTVTATDES